MTKIILINGDGIGAEVIPAAHQVLATLDLPLEFVYAQAASAHSSKPETPSPTRLCDYAKAQMPHSLARLNRP